MLLGIGGLISRVTLIEERRRLLAEHGVGFFLFFFLETSLKVSFELKDTSMI